MIAYTCNLNSRLFENVDQRYCINNGSLVVYYNQQYFYSGAKFKYQC